MCCHALPQSAPARTINSFVDSKFESKIKTKIETHYARRIARNVQFPFDCSFNSQIAPINTLYGTIFPSRIAAFAPIPRVYFEQNIS